jgi:deoxyribonuclease V
VKLPPALHRWNLSPSAAIRLQLRLARRIREAPLPRRPRRVAGGDAAYLSGPALTIAAWVVYDPAHDRVIAVAHAVQPTRFPYVPGLLSFREVPALLAAARRLRVEPDVFMVDAHGRAHPRRLGMASHIGLLLDKPAIGCAKSRLCGEHSVPGRRAGSSTPLIHNHEVVGQVVRTRRGSKPVFVSTGHRVTLRDAVAVALACCQGYRLPEPVRLAHLEVTRLRREAEGEWNGPAGDERCLRNRVV